VWSPIHLISALEVEVGISRLQGQSGLHKEKLSQCKLARLGIEDEVEDEEEEEKEFEGS
jgi:hypothetical protein